MTDDERTTLLKLLAKAGSERCGYLPGAGHPELWPTSHCDCKYVPRFAGAAEGLRLSEQTGCCEMRAAYRTVEAS